MGGSIDYTPTKPPSNEVQVAIMKRAAEEADPHTWWAEPLCFLNDGNVLRGSTKLFLIGYSNDDGGYTEVDPEDDSIMGWRDARRILRILSDLSKKHRISWNIEVEGEPFGTITGTDKDEYVSDKADELLLLAGVDAGDPSLSERIAEIDRRFANRWQD